MILATAVVAYLAAAGLVALRGYEPHFGIAAGSYAGNLVAYTCALMLFEITWLVMTITGTKRTYLIGIALFAPFLALSHAYNPLDRPVDRVHAGWVIVLSATVFLVPVARAVRRGT